ncbi:gamma-glutamyl-gamma-aminobutyrate hydrolase family protein [Brevibacillus centrosporus]|jgi:putative glutamine amidotransferase|uniref:Putative glutamine amidotransferase n=1 Tax=Brevibacillus centrosporus TaxID=54910 RepID=A0A1I4CCZ7_9BACL|nr:gamma-glutamyl-gamma-aminobutyrate hydrolase family protein [Brevibacillus centrosporus]MED4911329.1 gamma-glutamyl-gamma-aminobutyrate hydrolase family protein [Brevibacillus centrosporus]SFK79034.1 putative glutamine amidotransferase [Brevibacillus centrosporus]
MKPLIGICANYTIDDSVGTKSGLGLPGQEWQVLADDYVKAIERSGGVPVILPVTDSPETLHPLLSVLNGVLFSGGSDIEPTYYGELPRPGLGEIDPKRDKHEIALIKKVLNETNLPVLGICRGSQLLNVAMGGTLYQDLQLERPEGMPHTLKHAPKYHPTHPAGVLPGSRLEAIFQTQELWVNSFNHQAVNKLGQGLKVTMTAPDGLVEGIEAPGERFVVAVQWHPEMMIDRHGEYLRLFEAFVQACCERVEV